MEPVEPVSVEPVEPVAEPQAEPVEQGQVQPVEQVHLVGPVEPALLVEQALPVEQAVPVRPVDRSPQEPAELVAVPPSPTTVR